MLRLRICTVKRAIPFVRRVHRRLPKVQGAMWASAVEANGELVGVAIVGWPARVWNADTLAVLRVAVVEGHKNACSMLYGSCSRAAKALGAANSRHLHARRRRRDKPQGSGLDRWWAN